MANMKAALLSSPQSISQRPLRIADVEKPHPGPGQVLLRVRACGVCRTDLHIVEGELPPRHKRSFPATRSSAKSSTARPPIFPPVRASAFPGWEASTAPAPYCRRGMENLCDAPTFTGYSVDGGYAEYRRRPRRFRLPAAGRASTICTPRRCSARASSVSAACASRVSSRASTSAFSASARRPTLAIAGLAGVGLRGVCFDARRFASRSWRRRSARLGWAARHDKPPVELDRAVTFAPSGDVVVAALASLRKGGVVAINAIHLDRMPQFDYDTLLWGERQIRSVANMTRADARDFLALAAEIRLQPKVTVFPLDQANEALIAVKNDAIDGAAVIKP